MHDVLAVKNFNLNMTKKIVILQCTVYTPFLQKLMISLNIILVKILSNKPIIHVNKLDNISTIIFILNQNKIY